MHVFIFFNIINYFLDKKIISDLFNTYNQVLTIFLAQSMTSKLRQRSTQTKGMVKIIVNYYYFSVHFRWKYWKQELKNKTNPSAKFQYTITKSDISSKGFWNYGWNGASQCIVSFHDFIGEQLHSITMNHSHKVPESTGSRNGVEGCHFIKLWYEGGISLWNDKLLYGTRP